MSPDPTPDLDDEVRAARPRQPLGPWWLGVLGLAVAAALLVTQNLRLYGLALGATLGILALVRALVPEERAGGLVVRGRWVDVLSLALLGVAVAVLAVNLRLV